jgi:hypothetical protein
MEVNPLGPLDDDVAEVLLTRRHQVQLVLEGASTPPDDGDADGGVRLVAVGPHLLDPSASKLGELNSRTRHSPLV